MTELELRRNKKSYWKEKGVKKRMWKQVENGGQGDASVVKRGRKQRKENVRKV